MKLDRLKLPHVRMTSKDLDVDNALRVKLYGRPADVEKAWLVVAKARLRQACDPTSRLVTLARPIGATGVRMAEAEVALGLNRCPWCTRKGVVRGLWVDPRVAQAGCL